MRGYRRGSVSALLLAVVFGIAGIAAGCATVQTGLAFKDLEYPLPTKTVDVDGMQVAYSDTGAGARTLILIHGLGSYSPVWVRNTPALAKEYRVVAIDLPGYGKSSKANYQYSMEFFARVVDRVIDALKLEHVVLVGHSMGGQIAMTHAILYPSKVEALVLVAPAGFERFGEGEGRWLAEATSKDFVKLALPENVYANYSGNFYDMPKEADFMIRDRVRVTGGADFDDYAYAISRSVKAMIDGPVYDKMASIAVPVLVTYGNEDGLIPNPYLHGGSTRAVAEEGTRRLKRAELVMIPKAGHMVQFEQPALWDKAVLEFLRKLPAPAATVAPAPAPAVTPAPAPTVAPPPAQ